MKIFLKKSLHVLIGLGLTFSVGACDLIQDFFPEGNKEGKITCRVDGESFEAAGKKNLTAMDFIIAEMQQEGETFLLTVFGVSQYEGGALAVGFKIAGYKLEDLQPGMTLTDWNYNEDIVGSFDGVMGGVERRASAGSEEALFKASSNHSDQMSLTITAIDLNQNKISGTFFFHAKDKDNGKFLEVTEGKFTNVQWTVL